MMPIALAAPARPVPIPVFARAYGAGALAALCVLSAALWQWSTPGQPVPPSLSSARFSVAVLAGVKQAAQTAPENVDQVAESVKTAPEAPKETPVVSAKRETSLPEAKKAAQSTNPAPDVAKPVEVLPPAQVSMPGGRLMAEEARKGDGIEDPFAIKPRQVFVRLLVDKDGKVVRSGIVRGGGDPMRDGLILRALASRTFSTESLLKVGNASTPTYQLDMVIDYGTNDMLP